MKLFLSIALLSLPLLAMAELPKWQIIPDKSSITFTATQNNAPVTGQFKTFTGEITFDSEQLSNSNVTITIDTDSVTTSYAEIAETLKKPDWFDVKIFPKATFKATSFSKMGDHSYQANGTLTLRDKSVPLSLTFDIRPITKTTSVATGETILQRTTFGIGKGEWANTDSVKDEVKVNFSLTATKK
jgi:polyisoprenoid-binding protein YceI